MPVIPKEGKRQGPTTKWLIERIDEFLALNKMDGVEDDENYFGWLAIKDRTMVKRLREGHDISITKMDDVIAFMRNPVEHYLSTGKSTRGVEKIKALKPLTINKEL